MLHSTGLALVLIAFVMTIVGAWKGWVRVRHAGSALNTVGSAVLAIAYAQDARYGFAGFFTFLTVVNAAVLLWGLSTDRKQAQAR